LAEGLGDRAFDRLNAGNLTGSHAYTMAGIERSAWWRRTWPELQRDRDCLGLRDRLRPIGRLRTSRGTIDSSASVYTADPTLAGKATFGLGSDNQRSRNVR
jgi:hypothetical protein